MDSCTDGTNVTIAGLWKHRRTVQCVAIAADARGELALAIVPLLRWTRRALRRVTGRPGRVRTIPSLKPA